MRNKKKGFTLVELLAVIVILAIILVIAVPKIMETIKKAKTGSMESSAKLIAKSIETNYQASLANGEGGTLSLTGSCLDAKIADIDLNEYESCTYTITDGKAKVTLKGKDSGKFAGLTCTDATKTSATCSNEPEPLVTIQDSFADYSLADLKTLAHAAANKDITYEELKTTYNLEVGAERSVDLGDLGTHTVRISNMSNPDICSTEGFSQTACGFVLEFSDVIASYRMNDTLTNVGGWPASNMHTYLSTNIYDVLPSDLRNVVIDTKVISGHGSTIGETNFTSTDKLYLLSTIEVWGTASNDALTIMETRQLDYYLEQGVTLTENKDFAIKKNSSNVASGWWLRAARSNDDYYYDCVSNSGSIYYDYAVYSKGVSPAFRLG